MKKKISAILIGIVALISMIFVTNNLSNNTAKAATTANPVFFIPGAYSTPESWDVMFQRLDPANAHPIVKMHVNSNGAVSRTNVRTPNTGLRPFVTVTFDNILYNEPAGYENAHGLQKAIQTYKAQNPFQSADIIGQSMGGNVITRYMELDQSTKFNTFISMGTPYNMRAENSEAATPWLLSLIAGASRLDPTLRVINIIGSLPYDLSHDGVVSRDSAMAGRNIFNGNVGSFQYLYLSGDEAPHTEHIECAQVANIISRNINL